MSTQFAGDKPIALVTGGVRRVGLAVARSLAQSGCDLVVTYRTSADQARAAGAILEELGAVVRLVHVELDDPSKAEAAAADLARELPRLDVLVHNASVYEPTPLDDLDSEQALRIYRVNALAPLLLSKHLAPLLTRSTLPGGGSIVAMADIHSMGRPRRDFVAYSMSKAALAEMVLTLARALAPKVRVNAVAPGVVAWPESGYESDEAAQKVYLSRVPLGRPGTPEDAAEAVRWLALDATYTTGQIVRVDGGRFWA